MDALVCMYMLVCNMDYNYTGTIKVIVYVNVSRASV